MKKKLAGTIALLAVVVMTSAGSCGDGNTTDDPQKGFEKCLPGADKKIGTDC